MAQRSYPWETTGPTVTFATPEQVEVTYRVAGFGARILAALLDHLVIFALSGILGLGILLVLINGGEELAYYLVSIWVVISFLINAFYFIWAELRGDGRTWGKRLMQLRTVMISGHGLTFGASVIRNIARLVDNTPLLWLVPLFSRGQRRFGDLLAGTLVINERQLEAAAEPEHLPAVTYRHLAERSFVLPTDATRKLYPDDLNLLDHLFSRLRALEGESDRRGLCISVARKYVERLSLAEQADAVEESPQRFLEELFLYLRDRFEGDRF